METQKNFKKVVLPNGLTVLFYKMDSVMSLYVSLHVKVGAIYEKENERGISHFTEHAAILGTKSFPSKLDISREAQRIGAAFDAGTNKFDTSYWVKVPYMKSIDGLKLVYEFIDQPVLNEGEILKERNVVISEFNDFWKNPERRFWDETWRKRFRVEAHPYSYRPLGKPENIRIFDKKSIVDWKEKFYHPENMTLTIVGNFGMAEILIQIKKTFGKLLAGKISKEPTFKESYSNFTIHIEKDPRPQIIFNISFPALARDSSSRTQRMALGILSYVLCRGSGSRLFQRLRHKEALIYTIGGGTTAYKSMGALEFSSTTSSDNLIKVINSTKEELEKLRDNGINKEEFELAKGFINYSMLMEFDNPGNVANYLTNEYLDNKEMWFPEKYIDQSRQVKIKEVNDLAKKIFDFSKINIGFLGDISKEVENNIKKIFNS